MIWAFLICCIPLAVHLVNDRKGDNKKGNDLIVLTIIAALLALVNRWLFDITLLQSLALMAGIHIAIFDYAIVYFLRKNGVINPKAEVFNYLGGGWIDQKVWARMGWKLRLAIRASILSIALTLLLL